MATSPGDAIITLSTLALKGMRSLSLGVHDTTILIHPEGNRPKSRIHHMYLDAIVRLLRASPAVSTKWHAGIALDTKTGLECVSDPADDIYTPPNTPIAIANSRQSERGRWDREAETILSPPGFRMCWG